ncbi:Phosphoribosylanthranilate isomerase [Gloeothece citriformis PCC 7424]|uniref:N-(5'-phosphoribosyl)anthranilate isomerase n=1 Tax=Gloeothece citriformis (strain PCC 7424) TaxID=65393 RepID=TRPF_GLOC7|nr:phosphoribosylanthranilate isomerase [Gloeothece citriformis]B7KC08.1 RecName: Full=N-(5'-phosphoribosyl)anthranilate isomerase; Short=PRAI [Gloeothece citriformis PCC 7424]ACK68831.1 Phosphoribosylanthranilate isomerase [Gloeothece citriformis PCC 7424]
MRVKICGITQPEQGRAIANLGANTLGFICVAQSPRYVTPNQIREIIEQLPPLVDKIGVFVNAPATEIINIVAQTGLTGVQLHGDETPEMCQQLKISLPDVEIIRALRIKSSQSLREVALYFDSVNTLLLDAYHPHLFGGTGATIDWEILAQFKSPIPWLLAGGLKPDNLVSALSQLSPHGIDLSSGVERAPGDKDLDKVAELFQQLHRWKSNFKEKLMEN